MNRTWLAFALALALAGCSPLLETDFRRRGGPSGWTVSPSRRSLDANALWVADGNDAGGYLSLPRLRGRFGRLAVNSPHVGVQPHRFYRIRLRTRSPKRFIAGMIFQDANGRELTSDHYTGFDASADWQDQEFYVRARTAATEGWVRIQAGGGPIRIGAARIDAASAGQARRWIDRVYASLPPLDYRPPEDRWGRLPRTIDRLKTHQPLRVVMLGDSIINDTSNSHWQLLASRRWGGAPIEVVSSVRGGTGCPYYRKEGRVAAWVLDHQPDLVIIGGISNQKAAFVDEVVQQIRQASGAEILLMTGAIGKDISTEDPRHREPRLKGQARYATELAAVAERHGCEFLDMRAASEAYFQSSPRPMTWYMRDTVHANKRGRQIIGRILARYLSPDED